MWVGLVVSAAWLVSAWPEIADSSQHEFAHESSDHSPHRQMGMGHDRQTTAASVCSVA